MKKFMIMLSVVLMLVASQSFASVLGERSVDVGVSDSHGVNMFAVGVNVPVLSNIDVDVNVGRMRINQVDSDCVGVVGSSYFQIDRMTPYATVRTDKCSSTTGDNLSTVGLRLGSELAVCPFLRLNTAVNFDRNRVGSMGTVTSDNVQYGSAGATVPVTQRLNVNANVDFVDNNVVTVGASLKF